MAQKNTGRNYILKEGTIFFAGNKTVFNKKNINPNNSFYFGWVLFYYDLIINHVSRQSLKSIYDYNERISPVSYRQHPGLN